MLSLGSNTGDSRGILTGAVTELARVVADLSVSSLYLTSPQEYTDQADFFNLVLCGVFSGSPADLLAHTQDIERKAGRDRLAGIPKGPRKLDIDILLFGGRTLEGSDLVIPHPGMKKRQFVLVPLIELLPECADPGTGESYRDISRNLPDQGVRKVGNLHGN